MVHISHLLLMFLGAQCLSVILGIDGLLVLDSLETVCCVLEQDTTGIFFAILGRGPRAFQIGEISLVNS